MRHVSLYRDRAELSRYLNAIAEDLDLMAETYAVALAADQIATLAQALEGIESVLAALEAEEGAV